MGRHWASYGYVSVHLQHLGSDTAVWKGQAQPMEAMRQAVKDLRNSINRPLDVRFALDQLEKANRQPGPLEKRLDLSRIGMAGHSFGAWTTLAVAGEVFIARDGREFSLPDPRIKAAIAMSPPVPREKQQWAKAFGGIKIPCLHMTGTLDDSPIGDTKAKDRRVPFDDQGHRHADDAVSARGTVAWCPLFDASHGVRHGSASYPPACDEPQCLIDYLSGEAGSDLAERRHGGAVRSLSRLAWHPAGGTSGQSLSLAGNRTF